MRDISSANRAVWRRDSLQIGAAFGGWGTSPVMEESKVDGERARPKRLGTRQATGWVGLAVSCRTTYLDLVEPVTGRDEAFGRVEHPGYRGREFEATARIFEAHGIQQPRIPLLLPEFSNPLFLKLYCEGARDASAPLAGSEHLSAIFQRFVAGRKARVERALRLDTRLDVVGQAMTSLAQHIAERGDDRVPYEAAHQLVNASRPTCANRQTP